MEENKIKRAIGIAALALGVIAYILCFAHSADFDIDLFRSVVSGVGISARIRHRLAVSAVFGLASILLFSAGAPIAFGKRHRRSSRAMAISLALLPIERAAMLALRYYVYCLSSVSSKAIRERFVANSGTLEWIVILLTLALGAIAFASRHTKEY